MVVDDVKNTHIDKEFYVGVRVITVGEGGRMLRDNLIIFHDSYLRIYSEGNLFYIIITI